jgi:hypothetical protein
MEKTRRLAVVEVEGPEDPDAGFPVFAEGPESRVVRWSDWTLGPHDDWSLTERDGRIVLVIERASPGD